MVKVLRSVVRGPLERHIIGFAEDLLRQGYSDSAASQHMCFIAHLDRWMQAEGVGLDGLNGSVIERYLAQRRAAGYVEYRSMKALRPLLTYLAPLGVLPIPQEVPPDPVDELLGRYRAWLLVERGVTSGTARGYVDCVRPIRHERPHAVHVAACRPGRHAAFDEQPGAVTTQQFLHRIGRNLLWDR